MLLILEVLLTVSAWRKGWGPVALLPLAIGVPLAVVLAVITHSAASGVVMDVLVTIVLGVMTSKGRKPQPVSDPTPAHADEFTNRNAA